MEFLSFFRQFHTAMPHKHEISGLLATNACHTGITCVVTWFCGKEKERSVCPTHLKQCSATGV